MQCLQATGMVDKHLRSWRPRKTMPREDWLIDHFATSAHIQDELNFGGLVSVRTVNRQSYDHLHWNIRYCKNSPLPLFRQKLVFIVPHVWVWQHINTAFHDGNMMVTTALGGQGVTVWRRFSFNSMLDLNVIQWNYAPKSLSNPNDERNAMFHYT